MRKLAIIGNGGGGKSTAALRLGAHFGVPVFSVDQVQFLPGWERNDPARVAEWHESILAREAWIIDGWGAWELIEVRLDAADEIVLVDFPLEVHLAWAKQRERESAAGALPQEPPGCRYADVPDLMRETLERVDRDFLPRLREMFLARSAKATVLRAPEELGVWLELKLS